LSKRVGQGGGDLLQAARADSQVSALLTPDELARTLDPARYLGSTDSFIDRALAAYAPGR
jgi:3-carboxy-cis,cis-muconate cycloisomerase